MKPNLSEHSDDSVLLQRAKRSSLEHARKFWELLRQHSPKYSDSAPAEFSLPPKPQASPSFVWLLALLRIFPFLLIAGFGVSFLWDFPSLSVSLLGFNYGLEGLLRMVSVSGLIGYFTNWIAITMLFKPVTKRPIFGQGLVPAHKQRIAARLATSVSTELINPELIRRKLEENNMIGAYRERLVAYLKGIIDEPAFRSDLRILVVDYVRDLLGEPSVREVIAKKVFEQLEKAVEDKQLESFALKTYRFLRGNEAQRMIEQAIERLPEHVELSLDDLDAVLDHLPESLDEHAEHLETWATNAIFQLVNRLDIHRMVYENLNNYDEQRFEALIRNATNEQLRYIQYLGAVLGTVGGLVIWQPLPSLVVLATLLSVLFLADMAFFRFKSNR